MENYHQKINKQKEPIGYVVKQEKPLTCTFTNCTFQTNARQAIEKHINGCKYNPINK